MAKDTVNKTSIGGIAIDTSENKISGTLSERNPNAYYGDLGDPIKINGTSYDQLAYGKVLSPENTAQNAQLYSVESQLLRGTMSFSPERLKELDPSYQGYTHVFVLRIPPVMTEPAKGNQLAGYQENGPEIAKRHCQNLKTLFEMGCTAYSGTPDLTLNSTQVQVGYNDRSYAAPTFSEWSSTNFSLTVLETRGDPLRHGIEYYIGNCVGDPNLKATTMRRDSVKRGA